MRIQKKPNWVRGERRLCLTRLRWERRPASGLNYSVKLSVSICWKWQDLWVGLFIKSRPHRGWYAWVCLVPCVPIRLSFQRSYGGTFP